jgi:uncharacterized phiE125 gp8 family phage protein
MPQLVTITAPSYEPLSITSVEDALGIPTGTANTRLTALIKEARMWAEGQTGRALMAQTRELRMDAFPDSPFQIDCAPVRSITSFKYLDDDGTETSLTENTDFVFLADTTTPACGRPTIALAYGKSWPTFTAYPILPVRLRFACGYSVSTDNEATQQAAVPQAIKEAMYRYIRYVYDHSDLSEVIATRGADPEVLDRISAALCNPLADYRLWRF